MRPDDMYFKGCVDTLNAMHDSIQKSSESPACPFTESELDAMHSLHSVLAEKLNYEMGQYMFDRSMADEQV